ncbi:uncharacterized protein LOC120632211, partial [Pararge aegeria]|uniref:uncharacterized protein LOC120632211 n=1 Tax=Pararge aegeria TaxID=116150 RepID=UPI0019D1A16A
SENSVGGLDVRTREAAPCALAPKRRESERRRLADGYRVCLHFYRWPQIREDHPPNLSILVSGGKETNQDFLSSGERTGMSPALNRAVLTIAGDVVFGRFRYLVVAAPVQVRLERGRFPVEGARPVATERGGERDTPQSRVA